MAVRKPKIKSNVADRKPWLEAYQNVQVIPTGKAASGKTACHAKAATP
jgi:hypothetical protein